MSAKPTWAALSVEPIDDEEGRATYLGERLRRVALGTTAALLTARAFYPSEPELRLGAGRGMSWVLALLVVLGLAVASSLVGGRFRFRWSWADAIVVAFTFLVAISATHAIDRRPALNLAWEWAGMGMVYLLYRNLPRTRTESSVLAGAMVATAFAVSCYAIYQVNVELPLMQAQYLRDPMQVLEMAGVAPGGRSEEMFRNRLLGSNEPWSTFGLPGSLAGFIVGPLVLAIGIGLQNLVRKDAAGSRWTALALAAPIVFVILLCLIWTKSRSAWLGLLIAMIVLAWRARGQVPARVLWASGLAGLGLITAVAAGSLATGRLDRAVLTQSLMSFRYRWEYWQGAWGVVTGGASGLKGIWNSPTFWAGVGPGNFGAPYLLYKLPEASEEILDPHNMFLEVWAAGGVWALVALVAALASGLWSILGTAGPGRETVERPAHRGREWGPSDTRLADRLAPGAADEEPDSPARRIRWLIGSAGAGWALVVFFNGLNPFEGDLFFRWLILGGSWLIAVLLGAALWRRLPISASILGAAVLAVLINLLAAGGIGIPTVALALWSMLALGLNLRDDRTCGRLRDHETRLPALGLAFVWVALLGTFVGAVTPYWRAEAAIAAAEEAIRHKPPDLEGAVRAYQAAITADRYYARPWLGMANVETRIWEARGAKFDDKRWPKIPILLDEAAKPPRNPNSWSLHRERAVVIARLLKQLGQRLGPRELIRYRGAIVEALRRASLLHPTNAELHADLAEASAEIRMVKDAFDEAKEALRLDSLTPHLDKKLPAATRARLEAELPRWAESAASMKIPFTP